MDRITACAKKDEAIENFCFDGTCFESNPYGNGHINDTFLIKCKNNDEVNMYILQRLNHDIFKNPEQLMQNIYNVTNFLRDKICLLGGNPERETLNLIKIKSNDIFYKDSIGSYWRAYIFIDNSFCYDLVENPDDFYQSGLAFGNFQELLISYPANTLHEIIPNFHNTNARYLDFIKAVNEDKMSRVASAKSEIDFIISREKDTNICHELYLSGKLPLRVTHNDTKLNNVMIDADTRAHLCVLDLDTVMPGYSIHDFGDSIRFGASTALEDEIDLSKVSMDLNLFESYTKGFLESCGHSLNNTEINMLPFGAKIMTLECGIRFLTDYLNGDVYFKIHKERHNLDRCKTQLKLVLDMENKLDKMSNIINKYI